MSVLIPTCIRYSNFQSGWTATSDLFQFFECEEDLLNASCKLVQPFMNECTFTMEVENYNCSASFKPQPLAFGTCPSSTFPYEDTICDKWNEMMFFKEKYSKWPYVNIYAVCNLLIKTPDSTINYDVPAHIFYRRIKPKT